MGKIGFGAYRISIKSKVHYDALLDSLKNGISLIDTSTNYTNGESEELIGRVLQDHSEFNPIIVSKVGYLQGDNLQKIITDEDLVDLGENLKHSIHPLFLQEQLSKSLSRLQRNKIEVYLLHNPEYYFKIEGSSSDVFYERIKKAFLHLETEVSLGRIDSYGISSNHFILGHSDPEWVSLERIITIAKNISPNHHFTHIQFPMNLIEIGALEKFGEFGDLSLIEIAKLNNLVTMINRPLNAFTNNQLVRLATYEKEISLLDEELAEKKFNECLNIISDKWISNHQEEGETEIDDIRDVTLIKQFSNLWKSVQTPDSVDQIYHGHFFPFIAQLWNKSLTVDESTPFYELYEFSILYSRKNMTEKAMAFRSQALEVGLINEISSKDFALEVIETYLNYGIDYVLVGMKDPDYVAQLKSLF